MKNSDHPICEQIVTLTFHGVGEPRRRLDPDEEQVWLSQDRFFRVLDAIPQHSRVQITFDDGNISDLECALPALLDRGLRATFFILVGRLGASGALGTVDLDELLQSGMQVGSHGMWHRSWRGMSEPVALEEIVEAKMRLEQIIKRPVTKAACPFGAYDRSSLSQLRKAGFQVVYTSDRGTARPGHWLQARNTILKTDPPEVVTRLFSEKASSASAWIRGTKRFIKRWR